MNHLDYYNIYDEDELTKMVIFQNETFDLKELLSDRTPIWQSSVSIITPTQTASYAFNANFDSEDASFFQHASITDLLLSRLYSNYTRTYKRDDQKIYARESKNNIFVLAIESRLVVFIQPSGKINKYQYDELLNFIKDAKESDYATKPNRNGKIIFEEFFINDNIVPIDGIDRVMDKLKNHIVDIEASAQYNLNGLDFSDCKTETDIMRKAGEYATTFLDASNIITYGNYCISDANER